MAREHRFPVHVAWDGARRTTASVGGKQPLDVATPPEFRGTDPDVWSPEDLFVGAVGTCLAVTIAALAEREGLPLHDLDVAAAGLVGKRPDGRFGFVRVDQVVDVVVDGGREAAARAVVERAEQTCLVSVSLNIPVETDVRVHVAALTVSA
jgi:organic hydroperoxide reductase OsmC/OhrA